VQGIENREVLMTENIYNPQKLTEELKAVGLSVAGVSSTGRID
jgi:hypothetical protein